ncbi:MAG: FAD-dependent oxidoreductase [Alphaproteobacteria bacterium]|nr:FAD-dependent oxidoreductase [Alphaproteobacteria bacterium]
MVSEKTLSLSTTCCIAGGGPAGMMIGLLLAKAGIDIIVLEKHNDFLRDFRGDTVHPSTMEIIHELGLLNDFLTLPHQKIFTLNGRVGDHNIAIADFTNLSVHAPFIAMMPQWDFLNFLKKHAENYPNFRLMMNAKITGLIKNDTHIMGVEGMINNQPFEINSDLVIGADGRHSIVHDQAQLPLKNYGVPIDVLWFRLSRKKDDPIQTAGRFIPGKIMVMINREDYWQCGYVIPKDEAIKIQKMGLENFHQCLIDIVPLLTDRVHELKDWDQIKLLTVKIDRLLRWYCPGLLCIGDAAHAMSPVGGVGINLAIQDAVAAANILIKPLQQKNLTLQHLKAIQKRRYWPVVFIQLLQLFLQKRIIFTVLNNARPFAIPLPLRLLNRWPFLRRLSGYIVGMGIRPEHIKK